MKKHIVIVSPFAGSPRHGMVLRNYMMAREWVKQGCRVTIVASAYSHYRASQPDMKGRVLEETIDGIEYRWLWGPKYGGASNMGRVWGMLAFTLHCFFELWKWRGVDVVVCSSPHPFSVYPGYFLAKRCGAFFVYDIRDLWPLTPIMLGGYRKNHPFILLMQAAEDFACRKADLVIAVQAYAHQYLKGRGLPEDRFLPVYNGFGSDETVEKPLPDNFLSVIGKIRDKGGIIIGYTGSLGRANAMDVLIDALEYLPENINICIVGSGADKENLEERAACFGERVIFFDPIHKSQVASFLKLIDIAYVGGHCSPLYKYGASLTKLNDYMMAEKPVLYGLDDPGNAVQMSGSGLLYKPGSSQDLARAARELVGMSLEERSQLGKKGKSWVCKNRDMWKMAKNILLRLEDLGKR
ncbi:glycosyltransferase family 4 protein [Corticimicrobacter populi]|uniref:Glycosyltransferase WbuB n=1 Tax=Corticimicrobacter populi TaxID=2175229 RepID=A0A2V1JVN8_9BURK|nr:glycosyltransferase family 4 protein [Corticimicrobacter populi]PWF22175.1 glycosyltransferase WbuB [Corticimicrobacter populi]